MLNKSFFFIIVFIASLTILLVLPSNITGFATGIEKPLGMTGEVVSPADRITEKQIEIQKDRIIIYVNDPRLSRYANTNSMDPLLDKNTNGIEIVPESEEDIYVGDIVTYEQDGLLVVHRVMSIGNDEQGEYYITKGDNNQKADAKIRFEQIKYITIGILY